MRLLKILVVIAVFLAPAALAQFAFRPTLPPQSVIGNPNSVPGPAQAITLATLAGDIAVPALLLNNTVLPSTVDLNNLPPQTIIGNGTATTGALKLITFAQLAVLKTQSLPSGNFTGYDPSNVPAYTAIGNLQIGLPRLALPVSLASMFGEFPATNNFYWAAAGNDNNNCTTPALACQTLTSFNNFSFPANPIVHFNGGDTFMGGLTNFVANMTVTSYGSGQPTISSGNSTACATITNIGGVTINNIICQGGGNLTNTTRGIAFSNSTHSQIIGAMVTNSTISGYGWDCIGIVSVTLTAPYAGFSNANVSNNVMHDCTGTHVTTHGITACLQVYYDQEGGLSFLPSPPQFYNTVVSNNTAYNCTGSSPAGGNWTGGGMVIGNQLNASVTHNLVHDTGALQGHLSNGPVGISFFQDNTTLVAFNEVYHTRGGPGNADGEGIDISNTDNTIAEYNYIHDASLADILLGTFSQENNDVTIRFNITEQGPQSELSVHSSCGSQGCLRWKIYNNTFVGGGIQSGPNSSGNPFSINLSNNIFINTNGSSSISVNLGSSSGFGGTYVITGNDYSNSAISVTVLGTLYSTLATLQAACSSPNTVFEKTGGCVTAVGTTSNPNLVGTVGSGGNCSAGGLNSTCPAAYELQSGSPANQPNGVNLFTAYGIDPGQQDFYGTPTESSVLPIGAHMGPTLPATCANQLVLNFFNSCAIINQPAS